MSLKTKQILLFIVSLITTFVVLRVSLYISPNSNFDVAGYNIHHLYTGLVILTIAVIPIILFPQCAKINLPAIVIFASGLSMALDEWVYLIATDGSDAAYLLPISLWGAIIVIGLTCIYALLMLLLARGRCNAQDNAA